MSEQRLLIQTSYGSFNVAVDFCSATMEFALVVKDLNWRTLYDSALSTIKKDVAWLSNKLDSFGLVLPKDVASKLWCTSLDGPVYHADYVPSNLEQMLVKFCYRQLLGEAQTKWVLSSNVFISDYITIEKEGFEVVVPRQFIDFDVDSILCSDGLVGLLLRVHANFVVFVKEHAKQNECEFIESMCLILGREQPTDFDCAIRGLTFE